MSSMTPQELAAAVREVEGTLTARPWNRFSADETLWWMVPAKEWPAYQHGKLVFSFERAPEGHLFAGLNVEKGFGSVVAEVYPAVRRRRQVLEPGWAWNRLIDGSGPAVLDEVLVDLSADWPVRLWVEAAYVSDPSDYDPHDATRQKESIGFDCSPAGLTATTVVAPTVLRDVAGARRFAEVAARLCALPEAPWVWVDVYAGVAVARDARIDATRLYQDVLARFRPWV